MRCMTLRAHVGHDGVLRLDAQTGLRDRDVEVVVVIQPLAADGSYNERDALGWPQGFLQRTFGSIPDLPDTDEKYDPSTGKYIPEA